MKLSLEDVLNITIRNLMIEKKMFVLHVDELCNALVYFSHTEPFKHYIEWPEQEMILEEVYNYFFIDYNYLSFTSSEDSNELLVMYNDDFINENDYDQELIDKSSLLFFNLRTNILYSFNDWFKNSHGDINALHDNPKMKRRLI